MTKHKRQIGVILLVIVWGGFIGMAQVSSQSSASASLSTDEPAEATIGTFVFEEGQALAVEIVRQEPCPCLCGSLLVSGFQVLDEEGTVVFTDEESPLPISYDQWVGQFRLADSAGDPLDVGRYTVVVTTTLGTFRAKIEVVPTGAAGQTGRVSSEAAVCGICLELYRLVSESDGNATVMLHPGERLMVALPGTPSTGYAWEIDAEPEGGVLERIAGVDFLSSSNLLGAPGTFFFRYRAVDSGRGEFTLSYRRPWETLPPLRTFCIFVAVQ
jgi:inhibitor of cysteine peptidase